MNEKDRKFTAILKDGTFMDSKKLQDLSNREIIEVLYKECISLAVKIRNGHTISIGEIIDIQNEGEGIYLLKKEILERLESR